MSFVDFMKYSFLNRRSEYAALAQDIVNDKFLPETDDYRDIYEHIVYEQGASDECIRQFKECWEMYREKLESE